MSHCVHVFYFWRINDDDDDHDDPAVTAGVPGIVRAHSSTLDLRSFM